ncbi:cbb3-type cytochrome c oxidase subunit II [Mucilaginibacter pedocola]|uniref:Cytochrome-c oxidase n=1 Tax=Mucilaginibacter pedocola TaxID=1792845 RepID=A0A1S9PA51_9SPHI|nr:cbb3-type cytochrome c oxidase subunit II [Mucilaginibacter pedocola]OOQ57825.1 cytochrome-c oxidase [Mucilaginibacter pedocola]
MDLYSNHKKLYMAALGFFLVLTLFVAIIPALSNQQANAVLPGSRPLNALEKEGKAVFIAEGCVACHTQQVRNLDMDKNWGSRPSIAADYAGITRTDVWRNTATLMGSERTGPDLTNIGNRQPAEDWHLLHLYNPRLVVGTSVMPSYEWLFESKEYADTEDKVLNIPGAEKDGRKVVASRKAMALVAYLQSLKQLKLPDGRPVPVFLYSKDAGKVTAAVLALKKQTAFDGEALYTSNCSSCHQPNGQGIPGAFPSLKGSAIVLDTDPLVQVTIIMKGYDGRAGEGYGAMPAVGTNNNLKPEEVAAIVNHERSSWGNQSKQVTAEEVKKIISSLK